MVSASVWAQATDAKFYKDAVRKVDMYCLHNGKASIKKNQDFKRVYSQGKYAADPMLVAYALANGVGVNRLGITVSKKIGCAVVRNRVRRWIKESYRLLPNILEGQAAISYDIVFIARAPAGKLIGKGSFNQINKSVKALLVRLEKKL